jgi:5-hydroxyisourate hydrolase
MSLSTHVLDTAKGEPAVGVPVRLQRLVRDSWVPVADGNTDADGRLRDWVPASDWEAGRYRLVFETGGAFFPEVVVVFEVLEPWRPHHVPLLLSPYGYTTYRGS